VELTLINFSVGIGNLVVVALTIERFISICFPIFFRAWNSPKRALTAVAVAFFVPLAFYVPYSAFRYEVVEKDHLYSGECLTATNRFCV
jgi:hypothetical protein